MDTNALKMSLGSTIIAIIAYLTLENLLIQVSPSSGIISGSGDLGAVLSVALFALGAFITAIGLTGAINKE